MSTTEDFLEHYGVKGMKWGQRLADSKFGKMSEKNVQRSLTDGRTAAGVKVGQTVGGGNWAKKRAANKEHKAWKKNAQSGETANAVFQEAIKTSKKDFNKINNSPKYKGKDLSKNPRLARDYDHEVSQKFNDHMVDASVKLASNKTGDRVMVFQFDRSVGMMRANEMKKVEHADNEAVEFRAVMDSLGHIVELLPVEEDSFIQQADAAVDFLAHYGVKGMKWGTRKGEVTGGRSKSGSVKDAASEDAQRVNSVHAKVVKNKSLKPLSNKELQDAISRMNLEQQYSRLTGGLEKTRTEKAKDFISSLIKDTVQETIKSTGKDQVKLAVEKKTQTGRHDPVTVAKRQADIASAKARTRAANAA